MLSEAQRRVLAHLGEPQSARTLTRLLQADPHAPFDPLDRFADVGSEVMGIVNEQLVAGNIVSLGTHSEAKSLVRAITSDKEAISPPAEKLERLSARLESGRDYRLDTGELYILSEEGLRKLTA